MTPTALSSPPAADPAPGGREQTPLAGRPDVLVANGVATEPLAVGDLRLVERHPELVVRGIKAAMRLLRARRAVLALNEDADGAIAAASGAIAEDGFAKFHVQIVRVPPLYPLGHPLPLTRHLGAAASPDLVLDLARMLALGAKAAGPPLRHRHVAVVGAVAQPRTWWAPLGMPVADLVAASRPIEGEATILIGGPLTGRLAAPDARVGMEVGTVTVLPADHPLASRGKEPLTSKLRRAAGACETCRRCTEACAPAAMGTGLSPDRLVRLLAAAPRVHADDLPGAALIASGSCSGCGLCTVVCPLALDPAALVGMVREAAIAREIPAAYDLTQCGAIETVPRDRLALRLDLARYASDAPWAEYGGVA